MPTNKTENNTNKKIRTVSSVVLYLTQRVEKQENKSEKESQAKTINKSVNSKDFCAETTLP